MLNSTETVASERFPDPFPSAILHPAFPRSRRRPNMLADPPTFFEFGRNPNMNRLHATAVCIYPFILPPPRARRVERDAGDAARLHGDTPTERSIGIQTKVHRRRPTTGFVRRRSWVPRQGVGGHRPRQVRPRGWINPGDRGARIYTIGEVSCERSSGVLRLVKQELLVFPRSRLLYLSLMWGVEEKFYNSISK